MEMFAEKNYCSLLFPKLGGRVRAGEPADSGAGESIAEQVDRSVGAAALRLMRGYQKGQSSIGARARVRPEDSGLGRCDLLRAGSRRTRTGEESRRSGDTQTAGRVSPSVRKLRSPLVVKSGTGWMAAGGPAASGSARRPGRCPASIITVVCVQWDGAHCGAVRRRFRYKKISVSCARSARDRRSASAAAWLLGKKIS